jgi:hypothetical protein
MNRSPIAATLLLVFFGIGVPVALTRRLAEGTLPLRPFDVALLFGCCAWVFVARAVLERDEPLNSVIENRLSPTWQANSLVEQSLLGVGFTTGADTDQTDPRLYRLHSPYETVEALLPTPVQAASTDGRVRGEFGEVGLARPQPTLHHDEPADPLFHETEEYIVGRGDTFWSIAELRLGDGRHWKSIEQVNVGREVTPNVLFASGNDVRIGWSILVPVMQEEESAA